MQFLLPVYGTNTLNCLNSLRSCVNEIASYLLNSLIYCVKVNHDTASDIGKLKERVLQEDINNPIDAPHLFVQNAQVDEFNQRIYNAATGNKYKINAQDSVIGANSSELREKNIETNT